MSATNGALSNHLQPPHNFCQNLLHCILDDIIVHHLFGIIDKPHIYVQTLCYGSLHKGVFRESVRLAGASFQQVATYGTLDVALGHNNKYRHRSTILGGGSTLLEDIAIGVYNAALAMHKERIDSTAMQSLSLTKCISSGW